MKKRPDEKAAREPSDFGRRLRDLRVQRGISLTKLAASAGLHRGTVHKLESGERGTPSADTAARIAKALEVPVEVLVGGERDSSAFQDLFAKFAASPWGLACEGGPASEADYHGLVPMLRRDNFNNLPSILSFQTMKRLVEGWRSIRDDVLKWEREQLERWTPKYRDDELVPLDFLQPEEVDLVEYLRRAVSSEFPGARQRNATVRLHIDAETSESLSVLVRVHEEHLSVLVFELMRNAVQALPRAGAGVNTIDVTLRYRPRFDEDDDDEQPRLVRPDEFTYLEFRDNGGGVEEAYLPFLFDPLFSLRGLPGLGLTRARLVAEEYGGDVTFKNMPPRRPGDRRGALVTVRLYA